MNQEYVTKENIARHFAENLPVKYPSIEIKGMEIRNLISLHTTLGRAIRNDYKLWMNNNPLTNKFFVDQNPEFHPDEVSQEILLLAWKMLNESWPFHVYGNDPEPAWSAWSSSKKLKADKFYGFLETGGVFKGKEFDTEKEALEFADFEFNEGMEGCPANFSTSPDFLGIADVTVLSGRAYVDALYEITGLDGDISEFGHWTEV